MRIRGLPSLRDESGQAAVLFAMSLFVLVLVAGFALDLARAHVARAELQEALDAASLAGAQAAQLHVSTSAETICDQWGTDPATGQYTCLQSHQVVSVNKWMTVDPSQAQQNATRLFNLNVSASDGNGQAYQPSNFQVSTSGCDVVTSAEATIRTLLMRVLGSAYTTVTSHETAAAQASASGVSCQ